MSARSIVPRLEGALAGRGWLVALLCAVALVLLAMFAYAPLFGGGMILTGDTLHAWRVYEIGRCLDDGQLPCRWAPDLGNGYGFPLFNYYPPLPYYAGDLLHRLGFSYLRSVDLLYVIGLAGAGLSMFALARRLWGDLGGLVSAVAYVYAPYLALDVYMRGALAELWALAFVPALLWAVYELVDTGKARYAPLVALFTGMLLLSHSLVALIALPAVAIWAGALLLLRGRAALWPLLIGAGSALWGLGLAAFFTLPALFEGDLVQLDSTTQGPLHYSNHFAAVSDLFLQRTSDYSALLGAATETPIQIGWFHWVIAGLSLPAGVLLWRSGKRRPALAVALLAVFFGIGVYMAISASEGIWDTFDALRFLQFPWRYLGLVSIATAALAGVWLALLRDRPLWAQLAVAAVLVAVFIGSGRTFFQPLHRCTVEAERAIPCAGSDDEYFFSQYSFGQQGSIRDYLPKAVEVIPEPPSSAMSVVDGSATLVASDAGSDSLELRVDAATPSTVQASIFDYPNWRVRVDGQRVESRASSPNGLVTFDVPPGEHDVELTLENTALRSASNALSMFAWGALALTAPAMVVVPRLLRRRAHAREARPSPA